jgi:serine/threonine-protein kinase
MVPPREATLRDAPTVSPPLTLLYLVGRALLQGTGDARDVWLAWQRLRDEPTRQAEVRALVEGTGEEVRRALTRTVLDLAPEQSAEVRQALASALAEVVRRLRRGQALRGPDDLAALWPAPLPVRAEAPDAEAAIVLRVSAGPHAGRSFTFTGHDTFLVGRSSHAHFNLGADRYFSRIHFVVEANPPHARLLDMGSHNGTFVNGRRVPEPVLLADGDRIQAGHTVLVVAVRGRPAAHPPSLAEAPSCPPPLPTPTVAYVPAPTQPCRACNPGPGPLPLCPACQERIAAQPQPVPGYSLVRELGRGGMGVVHLALRQSDGAVMALKTILPAVAGTAQQVERFLREADVLRQLDHANIVAFREMGEAGKLLYFAMDYVPGTDAARLLREHGPLPVARAVDLVCQLLHALDYAHGRRFVHRDVKPANLLVTREGGGEYARLADFGLARVYQASQLSGLTVTGAIGGTPSFMAPEQVTAYREARPPVDQYAAAATLYNLLTGHVPYDPASSVHKQLEQLLYEDPVPIQQRRPDLPDELAAVIHRALAREPRRRFADARSFRRALRPFA